MWHRTYGKEPFREETRCHMGYSFWLAARVLLYVPSHRQDNTYHGFCYTSCGALAGTRNSSMGPPWRIAPMIHRTLSERSYHRTTSRSNGRVKFLKRIKLNWLKKLKIDYLWESTYKSKSRELQQHPVFSFLLMCKWFHDWQVSGFGYDIILQL